MAIRSKRFPEYELNLYVVSGTHSAGDAIRFYEGLGAADATRWLTYFEPGVEMDGHDVASLPKLRRIIAAKQKELFANRPAPRVVVCSSPDQKAFFVQFWSNYLGKGEAKPVSPAIRCSLEAAYELLGLPEAARKAVSHEIEARALAH